MNFRPAWTPLVSYVGRSSETPGSRAGRSGERSSPDALSFQRPQNLMPLQRRLPRRRKRHVRDRRRRRLLRAGMPNFLFNRRSVPARALRPQIVHELRLRAQVSSGHLLQDSPERTGPRQMISIDAAAHPEFRAVYKNPLGRTYDGHEPLVLTSLGDKLQTNRHAEAIKAHGLSAQRAAETLWRNSVQYV